MSGTTINVRNIAPNFVTADINREKAFIFDNNYESGTLLNASGGTKNFPIGLVMGRISASDRLVPFDATANDGSQFPVGILADQVNSLANNGTQVVEICVFGEVNQNLVSLDVSNQTLETVVTNANGRRVKDLIKSENQGLIIRAVEDNTFTDN